jgi:uncharacterized membrane protein
MSSILDKLPVTTDPMWPWSVPKVGWLALAVTGGVLLAAAAWSYLRVPGAKMRRVGVVLAVRVLALLLIFLALSGTSCVRRDEMRVPSILLVGIDASASMDAVRDELGKSRWEYLKQILRECKGLLQWLRDEHNIQVVFFRFGDDVSEIDPDDIDNIKADGKRTDTAQFLRYIYEKYRGERYLRGCLILSDGADNVASTPSALELAAQVRNMPCPVYTFAFGDKATTSSDRDIVVTSITTEPSTVAIKNKLTVHGTVDALGYANQKVTVKVFLTDAQGKETEVASEPDVLRLRKGNHVQVTCDAPAEPGEYKVTLKVWDPDGKGPLPLELSRTNNAMDTFVTVTREGLSVLLVERQERFPEPQMLLTALAADKRIRVYVAWLRGKELLSPDQKGLFQFDQQPYDVVILGDVTPERLKEADPDALQKLRDRVVNKRTGLLMLGGENTLGKGEWAKEEVIGNMMPVKLNRTGHPMDDISLKPTAEGLKYVLRLREKAEESLERWEKVQTPKGALLHGFYHLGDLQPNAKLFAESAIAQEPLLVGRDVGTGRTMVFACDTTHLWVRPDNGGEEAHARFWQRVVLWLARQEDTEDNLRVRLDTRRLALGDKLGFGVELYGKQREEIKDARYTVKIVEIVDKGGVEAPVEVVRGLKGARDANEARGVFKPPKAGEYRVEATATGTGKDDKGKTIEVTGKAAARFIVYQDDAETAEKAANPDFLRDLARDGGGQDARPDRLEKFLKELPQKPLPHPPPKPTRYPDWRVTKGRSPFLLAFILLFVQLLALEWFLRRRWGMV